MRIVRRILSWFESPVAARLRRGDSLVCIALPCDAAHAILRGELTELVERRPAARRGRHLFLAVYATYAGRTVQGVPAGCVIGCVNVTSEELPGRLWRWTFADPQPLDAPDYFARPPRRFFEWVPSPDL